MILEWLRKKRFKKTKNRWFGCEGDRTLALNYPLTRESLVIDVGGYKGDFCENIYKKFGCKVVAFEPVPEFSQHMIARFSGNDRISIHPFGLGVRTEALQLLLTGDGSSHIKTGSGPKVECQIKSVHEYFTEKNISKVDLMQINIEGAEYDLLEEMISSRLIEKIAHLQIQFHREIPGAYGRRDKIRQLLSQTHDESWSFWFIWESWKKKS